MKTTSAASGAVRALLLALASGAMLSAQVLLPNVPPKQFGGSVTPAYEGWYDNPDGSHAFVIGYFSRNTEAELDVPIGLNNHFEPGNADMGQPTHFLPGRRYGIFTFTMPKDFTAKQKINWVIAVNGIRTTVPFHMSPDYNITPFESSEESPGGGWNLPPVLRFLEKGSAFSGPVANPSRAIERTATAGVPMGLDFFADDDAKYSSGTNAPRRAGSPPVTLSLAKYRGPGPVKFADARPKLEAVKGGAPDEPYSGKGSTTVTFGEPGDYMLHVTANDYSGNGGGGSACCWTNAIVKVAVGEGKSPRLTGGQ